MYLPKKIFILFLFFALHSFARYDARPARECPAFNNMKHTVNTHQVILDKSRVYTVLREHKGQKLVLVSGEQPAQRWVDGECFDRSQSANNKGISSKPDTESKDKKAEKAFARPREMLLALSWHNAFCETHRSRRECGRQWGSRNSDNRFVLHGLWPQPRDSLYCNVPQKLKQYDKTGQWNRLPKLDLSDETRKKLLKVMPGSRSNLHRHEWIKHGSCSGMEPDSYYREAVGLTEQVNYSRLSRFFESNVGKVVTLGQIRFKVDESFGKGSGKRVEMRCKKGLITELWFRLGSGSSLSDMLKNGKTARSRCRKGRIDRAGY